MGPAREWRVVDELGRPLEGLVAARPEADAWRALARADAAGRLAPDGPVTGEERLFDVLGLRPLAPLPPMGGEVRVARAKATGWLATGEGDVPIDVLPGNRIEPLVDSEMFEAVCEAVHRARSRLDLSQLLFEPGFVGVWSNPLVGRARARTQLMHVLREAAERGVHVRVLLNENAVIPDSVDEIAERTRDAKGRLEVRRFPLSPNVMHAKLLVRDADEAILVGPPFQPRFWDTPRHDAVDDRRAGEKPHHDMSLRVRGPAVAAASRLFVSLWNQRQEGEPVPPVPTPAPAGPTTLQALRTQPPTTTPDGAPRQTILEAYLRAIANARRWIYFETQYFTNRTIALALERALERNPELEVILAVNEHMDVPGYDLWQARRLTQMGWPDHPRLGVFSLWSALPVPTPALRTIYIHSKLGMVDDAWATLGSANLDSVSLQEADEFGVPVDPNVECNMVVLDGIAGAPATGEVAALRRRVWAEHLGDEGVWRADEPAQGWLALWRGVAQRNLRCFEDHGDCRLQGHVLPYRPPAPRLREMLRPSNLRVRASDMRSRR